MIRALLCLATVLVAGLASAADSAPRLVPPPGDHHGPVPVWAVPPGVGGSVIRFTLDGGEPTMNDPVLNKPWQLTDDTVVRVRRFSATGVAGPVTVGTYRIDFPLVPQRPVTIPAPGTYPAPLAVTLTCATPGAVVRYTTDGSLPTAQSPIAGQPITLTTTTTLRARSFGGSVPVRIGPFSLTLPTLFPSGIVSAVYVIQPNTVVAAPTFTPAPGIFADGITISLSSTTPGAVVRYTTDGSVPTAVSPVATAPVPLSTGTTVRAIAVAPTGAVSVETSGLYRFVVARPALTPGSGLFTDTINATAATSTQQAELHFTSDGSVPTENSPIFPDVGFPILINGTSLRIIATRPGWEPSEEVAGTYVLQVASPIISPPSGTRFADGVEVFSASPTAQSRVVLTVDGSDPESNGDSPPIILRGAATVRARAFRDGFLPSTITKASYQPLSRVRMADAALTVSEGDSAVLRIMLNEASDVPVTIGYDIARIDDDGTLLSQDLGNVGGQVIISPGENHADVPIPSLGDGVDEADEAFEVAILTADGAAIELAQSRCILTVIDRDPTPTVSFARALTTVEETVRSADIPLRLSGPSGRSITVRLIITRGTARINADIAPAVIEMTIPPGAVEGVGRFAIYDDEWAESSESSWLSLEAVGEGVLADPGEHRVDIHSDEFSSPVAKWIDLACSEIALANSDPPMASRALALMGVTMDRAVRVATASADGSCTPVGAVTAAASECLAGLFPARASAIRDAAIAQTMANEWSGLIGENVSASSLGAITARQVLAEGNSDGSAVRWPVVAPTGSGYWYSSWAYTAPALRPWWGTVRPWFLTAGNALRPEAPPAFGSPEFNAALQEVRTISDTRTNEQLVIAARWSDGPGTATPPGKWMQITAGLIRQERTGDAAAARLAALCGATLMDAGIACWDAKYAYWLIRPYQADRSIITPIGQPNFPSYVSGHSTFSGAAAVVLGRAYPAHAAELQAMAEEAAVSRLYGGIHYRFDNDVGLALGRAIGAAAVADDADGVWQCEISPRISVQEPAPGATLAASPADLRWTVRDGDTLGGQLAVTVAVSDGAGNAVSCSVETTTQTDGSLLVSAMPASAMAEGRYTAVITATDAEGHTGHGMVRFSVDPTGAPVVTITHPVPEQLVGMSVPLTVRGSVNQRVESLVVNGAPVAVAEDGTFAVDLTVSGTSATRPPLTLSGGINEIAVLAVDPAGNQGKRAFEIRVDDSKPIIRIESPVAGSPQWSDTVTVTGFVQDIVLGSIDTDNVVVTVAGRQATVRNGTFLVSGVPLDAEATTITATAVDEAGNEAAHAVTVERRPDPNLRAVIVSGDQAEVGPFQVVPPVVVRVVNGDGMPVPSHPVTFTVSRGDGTLAEAQDDARQRRQVLSDANGQASVVWTLGRRAGLGNQRLAVTTLGSEAVTTVTASVTPAAPAWVLVVEGQSQSGLVGQTLPQPIVARVVDIHGNPLVGAALTFTINRGGGTLIDPARSGELPATTLTITTNQDGLATARWKLGGDIGPEAHEVSVTMGSDEAVWPTTFTATAVSGSGRPEDTGLVGIVLGADQRPLAGVTLVIEGTTLGAISDANGAFTLRGLPAGHRHLQVNGTTANTDSVRYPILGFEVDLLQGATIAMPMPIYVPAMDISNQAWAGGDTETILALPGLEGAELVIAPNSTILPDGTRGPVRMYTAPVNTFAVPMAPPSGTVPPVAASLQPPGIRLDPPAQLRWPNLEALPPGAQTNVLSFDHDLGVFVSQGQATVSGDGLYLLSDPGTGITKSGWHFPDGTAIPNADIEGELPLHLELTGPTEVFAGMQVEYTVKETSGRPLPALTWSAVPREDNARVSAEIVGTTANSVTLRFLDSGNVTRPVRTITLTAAPLAAGVKSAALDITPTIEPLLAVDGNRDGTIRFDGSDATSSEVPFRWWFNDDADDAEKEIDSSADVPNSGDNGRDNRVNGLRDLVDFFPVSINLRSALQAFPPRKGYRYALRAGGGDLGVVRAVIDHRDAFSYLTIPQVSGYGPTSDELIATATVQTIDSAGDGLALDPALLSYAAAGERVVYLVEGRNTSGESGGRSLELVIFNDDREIYTDRVWLRLSPVEEMYRWVNLHHGAGLVEQRHTDLREPANMPDARTNGTQVILVHGFFVTEVKARAWNAEVFKRLHQTGSRAMFTAVAWPGHESEAFPGQFFVADLHLATERAFASAQAIADTVRTLPGNRRVILSHSLGAIAVGSAMADYGLTADRYIALDAAASLQVYDADHPDAPEMIHPDWRTLPIRTRCSEWAKVWPATDGRSGLTWRGRFGLLPGLVNLYSTGEEALHNGSGKTSEDFTGIANALLQQVSVLGNYSWFYQEIGKGRVTAASPALDHWSHGGWGFSNRYLRTETIYDGNGFPHLAFLPPLFQNIHLLSDDALRLHPVFRGFDDPRITDSVNGSIAAAEPPTRAKLLAQAIPQTSFAMGSNPLRQQTNVTSIDQNAVLPNRFPLERFDSDDNTYKWRHSDIKDVAYFYVHPAYEHIVVIGGLK